MRLTIDGRKVTAAPGETILKAAGRAGIFIPTLCHDEKLAPYASCFLCAVRVAGERRLMPACATAVAHGMEVTTGGEEVLAARRLCIELLLSDHCGECLPPCQLACPAGCDARDYLRFILDRRYDDALRLIRETVPLPATIGRVCPHPCEEECRRGVVDEPAAICALKRFAEEKADPASAAPRGKPPSGRRVAVIGSGPAGLSAAYFLALDGHAVTVFEAREKPGGMLRYGIPEYRLPKAVLDREIDFVKRCGVEIRCGATVGDGTRIPDILGAGYDAVLIAVGAQRNRRMGIEGEDLEGVLGGIDLLSATAAGKGPALGGTVLVVGGGDTAVDAARTALRLGAREVSIVYRRSREEMPAAEAEIKAAEEEGIGIRYLTLPVRISRSAGRLSLACSRMALGEPDESGRRRPVPVPGGGFEIACDTLIMAIGQAVDPAVLSGAGFAPDKAGRIGAEGGTLSTAREGVFACGDCVTGPDIAVSAVAAGRRAAYAIDAFLRTGKPEPLPAPFSPARRGKGEIAESEYSGEEKLPRVSCAPLAPSKRAGGFAEIEPTLTEEQALKEAYRCLECGCDKATDCALRDLALRYGVGENRFGSPGRRFEIDGRHPHILRDPDKCIKCGRCVRVCLEVQGIDAWGYVGRGIGMEAAPPFGRGLQDTACESCGQCVTACPTGAITEKLSVPRSLAARALKTETTCAHCGVGCSIILHSSGGRIVRVEPRGNGNLCEKGKFGFGYIGSPERILFPEAGRGRRRAQTTWDEAGHAIRRALGGVDPRALAVFVSSRLSDEEAYEAQKLARAFLGTNNVYPYPGRVFTAAFHRRAGRVVSPSAVEDAAASDAIVLLDPRLVHLDAVGALSIIAGIRNGARLLLVGRRRTKLDALAVKKLRIGADDFAGYAEEIALFMGKASRPVTVCSRDLLSEKTLLALSRFARSRGARLAVLCAEANAQGLLDAGVSPCLLPGQKPVTDWRARAKLEKEWKCRLSARGGMAYPELLSAMRRGKIKGALFLGGHLPADRALKEALRRVPFVVMQALVPSPLARFADVLLPAASWAETSGTLTRYDGRKLRLRAALPPLCGFSNLEIWNGIFARRQVSRRR